MRVATLVAALTCAYRVGCDGGTVDPHPCLEAGLDGGSGGGGASALGGGGATAGGAATGGGVSSGGGAGTGGAAASGGGMSSGGGAGNGGGAANGGGTSAGGGGGGGSGYTFDAGPFGPSGTVDPTLSLVVGNAAGDGTLPDIEISPARGLYVAQTYSGTMVQMAYNSVIRIGYDGTADPGFLVEMSDSFAPFYGGMALAADDGVFLTGEYQLQATAVTFRTDSSSALISSFADAGELDVPFTMIPLDTDCDGLGRVYILGALPDGGTQLNRYSPTGDLDTAYGLQGGTIVMSDVSDFHALSDGAVLMSRAAGNAPPYSVVTVRLLSNGRGDATFGVAGVNIIVGGSQVNNVPLAVMPNDAHYLLRGKVLSAFDSAGSNVATFGNLGDVTLPWSMSAVAVYDDGRPVVAGFTGTPSFVVMRLLTNGQPDPSFGDAGVALVPSGAAAVTGLSMVLAIEPNGRIVLGANYKEGGQILGQLLRIYP